MPKHQLNLSDSVARKLAEIAKQMGVVVAAISGPGCPGYDSIRSR
jgi:hypothetical protein